MRGRYVLAIATVAAMVAAGAWINAAGADRPKEPAAIVSEVDASKPGEESRYSVWRNGRFHNVKVPTKRVIQTDQKGKKQEVVVEDASTSAAVEAQLPPIDPAVSPYANPTPEQDAESRAFLGLGDHVFPASAGPGHSQGSAPGSPSDPPRGP